MTACPELSWQLLLAHRFDVRAGEPAELGAALDHLDACPACRREACAIDPTLVFKRLPPIADLDFDSEAERMRQAVSGMRLVARIEPRRSGRARAGRFAAAAGLAAMALLAGRGEPVRREASAASAVPGPAVPAVPARFELPSSAMVEEVGRPKARVYQLAGDRLSVVMIVDSSLDV